MTSPTTSGLAADHPDATGFDRLEAACAARGAAAMCDELAASLASRGRWHALFDLRLMQARLAAGLPATGGVEGLDEAARDRLDAASLAACREVGWPLLEAGQVAAAWMYLRAAARPDEVAARLEPLAARAVAAAAGDEGGDDEDAARILQEIVGVALWEAADPGLGIGLVLDTQGTCNAITAYEQAVSRLPAVRQEPAARRLVAHLHAEVVRSLAADLAERGLDTASALTGPRPLAALLETAGGLGGDPSIHVDVSHLQSVLRIARVSSDPATLEQAWELAVYGCRLPEEVTYPGEPPFENVAEASRLFYAAQIGRDVAAAVAFFRRAAATADPDLAGSLPHDTLVLLLSRLGRPAEALHAAIDRPRDAGQPSTLQAAGLLPSLVDLARAGDVWEILLDACRRHGDEVTFAATLAARANAGLRTTRAGRDGSP
jgi:hypothetical protein